MITQNWPKSFEVNLKIEVFFRLLLFACVVAILFLATTSINLSAVSSPNDKLNHMIAFSVLTFLADMSFGGPAKHIKTITAVLLLYGLMIELIQWQLPYRSFSLYDIAADAFAILIYWPAALLAALHLRNKA